MQKYWLDKREKLLATSQAGNTPLYVYDTAVITRKYNELQQAFQNLPFRIHYAMKANENKKILRHILDLGIGVDTVSPNEIIRALSVGFQPEQIIFTPSCPGEEEIKFAFDKNIHIHLGATEYFDFVLKNFPGKSVGLRINPANSIPGNQKIATAHQSSKFGIPVNRWQQIQGYLEKGLLVDSLHIHTGSDVKTWQDLARSADVVFDFAKHFKHLKYIDLGSGFKVKYKDDDPEIDLKSYANHLQKLLKAFPYPLELKFEPGKFLLSEAGVLLTRVNIVKQGFNKKFAGVNSGFHHLIRPMYYDAYHKIINLTNFGAPKEKYDVVGQLCEEDTFAYDIELCQVRKGDILMIMNAGAYGYSMHSEYNLRDKPLELLL